MAEVVMQRQAPFIEERAEKLLESVFGEQGLANIPQDVPAQQVAPLTEAQQRAVALAQEGLGAYQPFLDSASQTIGAGLGAISAGVDTLDPSQISTFMDPYSQQVTQAALAEFDRQAQMQAQQTAAQALGAGAFGGARFGVREAEESRN